LGNQTIDGVQATDYKKAKDKVEYCDRIKAEDFKLNCQKNRRIDHMIPFHRIKNLEIRDCQKLADQDQRDGCLLSMMWMIVTNNDELVDCQIRYGFDPKILEVCLLMRRAGPTMKREDFAQEAPQTDKAVLYLGQADGGLGRAAKESFDHPGGWTWSSRFTDLDNDGWVDIFNAEGAVRMGEFGWNVYMHNEQGRFVQKQFSAGLTNDFNLFSFVLIDYDHDGDLDIIGNGSEGPPQVYENQLTMTNNSIAFTISSKKGNTQNLNARLIIRAEDGSAQIREIKAGGGYLSVDAPQVFFGLGNNTRVESVEIQWPGGQKTQIKGPFEAGALYNLEVL